MNFNFNEFISRHERPFLLSLTSFTKTIADVLTLGIPLGLMALGNAIKPINRNRMYDNFLDQDLRGIASDVIFALGNTLRQMAIFIIFPIASIVFTPIYFLIDLVDKISTKPTRNDQNEQIIDDNNSCELETFKSSSIVKNDNSSQNLHSFSARKLTEITSSGITKFGQFANESVLSETSAVDRDQKQTQAKIFSIGM